MTNDGFDDRLRGLFIGMFLYLHERLAAHAGPDEINRVAREVLSAMDAKAKNASEDAPPELVSIAAARSLEWLRRPVRIVGRVATIRDTEVVEVAAPEGGVVHVETTSVEVADRHGESIWSLNVVGHDLVAKLHAHAKHGSCEFLGTMVLVPKGDFGLNFEPAEQRFAFALHIADVCPTASARDLVGASTSERDGAAASVAALASGADSPYRHLYGELVEGLGIVGLEDARVLDAMLRFTVPQACSTGRIGNASGRLHGLVVGPPGRGKKLLVLAARALQPCAAELSASKASPAGLVGTSHRTQDGWKSTPGLLPAAAHGVALLQDAHGLREADLRRIAPILQELIEDGVVRDSVVCGSERPAETSLLIDVNRLSQLRASGANGAKNDAPILRLRPLLSRFDVIAEIPEASNATWAVSLKMYDKIGTGDRPLEERGWVREVRLLVAHLRDAIPHVDLSGVRALMRDKHEGFRRAHAEFFAAAPEAGDLPTRLVVSFARLVAASARADARERAVEEDVGIAAEFVRLKLAFLCRSACPSVQATRAQWSDPRKDREAWVAARRGAVVRPADLAVEYEAERGVPTHERTMRRAVQRLGGQPRGPGLYLLP